MQYGDDLQPLAPQQLNAPLPQPIQSTVQALRGVYNLPQRMFEASEGLRQTGEYNPAPAAELMQMMLGGASPFAARGAVGALGGKLRLEPGTQGSFSTLTRDHDIVDEGGRTVGQVSVHTPKPGEVHIENVQGTDWGPGAFGHSATRSLIDALREHYPNMETITGIRSTGARKKWGNIDRVELKIPPVPLTIQRGTPIQSATGQTLTPIHGANFANRLQPDRVMQWLGPKE
jgi:hypothetical protein